MSLMDGLTLSQQSAVEHIDGPLLVLAGPGSGKTRVVTRRVAHLVERGVPPWQILAITFTNKASQEMAERVQHLLPGSRVRVSTFHKFCASLLRQYAEVVGLQANYSILDTGDQRSLLKEAMHDLDIDTSHFAPDKVAWRISTLKNDLVTAEVYSDQMRDTASDLWETMTARIYPAYQKKLLKANSVDFDDLLMHVARMLTENEDLRLSLDQRYRYIMVDEYQDTNAAQYQIVLALSQRFPNLCVTGDPDQSIYGWRGARIANILRFEKDFPSAKLIRLEENFRSSPEVLAAADSLIAHNTQRKEKHLIATQPSGPPVKGLLYENGNDEADGIAGRIRLAIDDGNWRPSDVAIFYRTNALSRQVELALQRMKVPYQIAAGVAFYERAEIKDAVAYLRLIANPRDRAAFIRVVNKPLRGLGETSRNRLLAWADREGLAPLEACLRAKEVGKINAKAVFSFKIFAELIKSLSLADSGSVADLLDTVLEKSKYRMALAMSPHEEDHERLQNLDELISAARQYDDQAGDERTLEGFLEQVSLVSETDSLDSSAGSVTLMTLHAAKGLEFPVVFIIGVEEGLLPHERAIKDESRNAIEEERRLMFVGMTRAKRELLLTHTAVRAIRGRLLTSIPSLFLSEFPHQQELQESVYGVGRAFKMPTWDPDDDVIDVSKEGFETSEETEEPEVVFNPPRRKGVLAKGLAPITEYLDEEEEGSGQWAVGSGETVAVPSAPSLPKDQGPGTKNSPRERKKKSPPVLPTLTTAASLLSGKTETVDIPIGFQPGMQVRHPRYGLGQVLQTGHIASRRTVTVMFEEDGRVETFVASKCPLQPVGL